MASPAGKLTHFRRGFGLPFLEMWLSVVDTEFHFHLQVMGGRRLVDVNH